MGASNFGRLKRADNYYTILMDYEDENGETVQADEIDLEYFYYSLHDICSNYNYEVSMRNRPEIASRIYGRSFGDVNIDITSNVFMNTGYHEGAYLDFTLSLYVYGCGDIEMGDIEMFDEQIDEIFEYESEMNAGMKAIQKRNAKKWIRSIVPTIEAETNEMLNNLCDTKLEQVAQFSNGETIYKKVG